MIENIYFRDTAILMGAAPLSPQEFLRLLKMCAAIWGVIYPIDRTDSGEFRIQWQSPEGGMVKMEDAADCGAYSFQVEGLLVKYLLAKCPPMPTELLGELRIDGEARFTEIKRSEWSLNVCSQGELDDLRQELYAVFHQDGRGFYAHDLKFADHAIDWLKEGKPCLAGACNKLPDLVL